LREFRVGVYSVIGTSKAARDNGILKVALVGVGSGTVQRVKKEMVGELAEAA
jgi:hypothetical protein